MFAKEAFLGVRPAHKVNYYVIASPAGAYFKGGVQPVSIWLSEDYARAGKGGTGAAKTGGNYAASLLPQSEAYENECDQVVFLDQDRNVDELGGMNVVFVLQGRHPRHTAVAVDPRGHHARLDPAARDGSRPQGRRTQRLARRVAARASHPATSSRCSPAAPRPWSRRSACSRARTSSTSSPSASSRSTLRQELTDIQYGRLPDKHGWLLRLDS